tara:strand:+ start:76 stop:582 length:507 start_codon:yes stop_codon:yes gene_type:complete
MLDSIYLICMPTIAYLFCVAMSYQSILSICRGECILSVCLPTQCLALLSSAPSPRSRSPPPSTFTDSGGGEISTPLQSATWRRTSKPCSKKITFAEQHPSAADPEKKSRKMLAAVTAPLSWNAAALPASASARRALLVAGRCLFASCEHFAQSYRARERKRSNDAAAH